MNPVARGSGKQGGHSRASHLLLHKAFLHNHTHVLVQQQVPNHVVLHGQRFLHVTRPKPLAIYIDLLSTHTCRNPIQPCKIYGFWQRSRFSTALRFRGLLK
eukprot:SAG25_NODE_1482_length_2933_cov_2.044107_2_plen_101_part_00